MTSNAFPFGFFDLDDAHAITCGKHSEKSGQKFAHDFGAVRLENESWTEARPGATKATNEGYLMWGMPVYAIADGEVVASWRNAPDNPAPGEIRPEVSNKRDGSENFLSAAGNHVNTVDPATGVETGYAHFMTGTVDERLVQNHSRFLRTRADNDIVGTRPTVRVGDLLGFAGNSGHSTKPHCHVIQIHHGTSIPVVFDTWWSKPGDSTTAASGWTLRKDTAIPQTPKPGPRILPPYRRGHGFVLRHGIAADRMQFAIEHAVASGYRPELIDGFDAGDGTFFNMICRPFTANNWIVRHRLDATAYQDTIDTFAGKGFRFDNVNSYLIGGRIRRSLIMSRTSGPKQVAYHGATLDEHRTRHHDLVADGFRPRNVSVVAPGGTRTYTALYERANPSGTVLSSRLTAAGYQTEMEANASAGRTLRYIDAYMVGGTVNFSAIWHPAQPAGYEAEHDMGPVKFQAKADALSAAGFAPAAVAGYRLGAKDRYAVAWIRP